MDNFHKNNLYLPNEIFADFNENISSSRHVAFAYAYYYYIVYLYRYCEYACNAKIMTQSQLKEDLGYSPSQKSLDYIIKKNGLLDRMGYTASTKDYPVSYSINDSILEFRTISQCATTLNRGKLHKNLSIKIPIKSFHRTNGSKVEQLLDGTYYEFENTHKVSPATFFDMMKDNDEYGVMAFYIYGYLKWKSDIYRGGYDVTERQLADDLKIDKGTLKKYLKNMDGKYIRVITGTSGIGSDRKSSSYMIIDR
ncbi:hypothetical protein M5X17_31385 [Paenibacillus alvei]|uniref:hypothetical protein n=1 Tax=Paenibacillus alvei TaxID=44250 RepID=UPI00227E1479|nr:hypothetical protein [Paenibacillus alvei]MCY9738198.1 hypothetical protein [Paenibacillus alvei]